MREKQGREDRRRIICEIVGSTKVASQEELSGLLGKRGLNIAQATLSRDIRELRIVKFHDGDGYFYRLPPAGTAPGGTGSGSAGGILSLEFSGAMAVLKTRPGHANMVAYLIDVRHPQEVAGTIAGDDTVLLILREGFSRNAVTRSLSGVFEGIEGKRLN